MNCLFEQLDTVDGLSSTSCQCSSLAEIMTTNLLEIRTVFHQVHAASVMISIHMDTSLDSLQHPFVDTSRACSASPFSCALSLVIKSFTPAVIVGFTCPDCQVKLQTRALVMFSPCQTPGESSHSCCGDDPHLVGLLVSPLNHSCRARAVVMVLSLSGFSDIFSIIWSNSSLMVIPGKTFLSVVRVR